MTNLRRLAIFGQIVLFICYANGYPDTRNANPNLDYELIAGGSQVGPVMKPAMSPTNSKPVVINTPPPVDPNSKTFVYSPTSKTWTVVKKNDPPPAEDALLWNQSNDKWLTQIARI